MPRSETGELGSCIKGRSMSVEVNWASETAEYDPHQHLGMRHVNGTRDSQKVKTLEMNYLRASLSWSNRIDRMRNRER